MAVAVKLVRRPPTASIMQRITKIKVGENMTVVGKVGIKARKEFVATWNHKPQFFLIVDIHSKPSQIRLAIVKRDQPADEARLSRYDFLAIGTKKRFQKMSLGFVPKTAKGRIRSIVGVGGAIGKTFPALPGIEARKQDEFINVRLVDIMGAAIAQGYEDAAEEISRRTQRV